MDLSSVEDIDDEVIYDNTDKGTLVDYILFDSDLDGSMKAFGKKVEGEEGYSLTSAQTERIVRTRYDNRDRAERETEERHLRVSNGEWVCYRW